eukprot:scaffold109285_cov45-Phaeocystis_antarctica.AAC.2
MHRELALAARLEGAQHLGLELGPQYTPGVRVAEHRGLGSHSAWGGHGTRYARHAGGWFCGALPGASCPEPSVRTSHVTLVRVARTHSTEAPSWADVSAQQSTCARKQVASSPR